MDAYIVIESDNRQRRRVKFEKVEFPKKRPVAKKRKKQDN